MKASPIPAMTACLIVSLLAIPLADATRTPCAAKNRSIAARVPDPGLAHEERLPRERLDRRPAGGAPAGGRARATTTSGWRANGTEIVCTSLGRRPHDGEVDLVAGELPHDGLAVVHEQAELDPGVDAREPGQELRREVLRGAHDRDAPCARPASRAERGERVLGVAQARAARAFAWRTSSSPARVSASRPPDALEERQPGVMLELLHLHRDRGLREPQLAGRAGERPEPRGGGEDLELPDGRLAHHARPRSSPAHPRAAAKSREDDKHR